MPAGSEPGAGSPSLPHTWRPYGVRLAGTVLGGMLLVVSAAAWIAFPPDVKESFTLFQRGTVLFLGGLAFAAGFALVRSRLVATEGGLTVVNGYRRRDYDWAEVVAIHLPRGAPWAMLDLSDGTTCPVMAVQGSDGGRARAAVRDVRALLG